MKEGLLMVLAVLGSGWTVVAVAFDRLVKAHAFPNMF